jgi:hypothetical protein
MPHVYREVDSLKGTPLAGDGGCVSLVKAYAPGLDGIPTSAWKAGVHVMDVPSLPRGTAIATFVRGRYPNKPTGNHAAFYNSQAFYVIER